MEQIRNNKEAFWKAIHQKLVPMLTNKTCNKFYLVETVSQFVSQICIL